MISRLILMRHAKSSWKYPDLSDHERPLNKRGRKAAVKVAKELIRLEWTPEILYSSDSERTKETWSRMNKHINGVKVEYSHKLYHSGIKKILKNIPDEPECETIMILGHNPGCADFLSYLCGEWHRMPTAATALLTIKNQDKSWKSKSNWILEELLIPREL
ncbi:MAG: histidine phosphatase family protein, partial [Candidatus Thermoplasmatota archaeon]|nr:histidine phosphatase family protein [Candidatus Thermoplasmatota archaeon]